jgi:RNA polymerase sigma factor for flagellar operon FliA
LCFSANRTDNRAGFPQQRFVDYQRLLLDHLELIHQIVRSTGRRRHLSAAELEDLASFVRFRLVDDDYAVLRKFQQRSSLWTYLAAVIDRLSLDFCVERWGKWRPSAMAERLGPVAVALERLVTRDHHPLEEAMEILRTNQGVALTPVELRALWDQIPARSRTVEVGEEAAADLRSPESAAVRIEDAAIAEDITRLEGALRTAFEQMSAQDRVLIALRFDQDLSLAEIARLIGGTVPTLHRRLERRMKDLRRALSGAGFDPREVSTLIGHSELALSPLLRAEVEKFLGPVRLSKRDG